MNKSNKTEVIIMVGVPRVGKTTYAKWLKKEMIEIFEEKNWEICGYDISRKELYGDKNIQGDFDEVRNNFENKVISLIEQGYDGIIIDNTNVKLERRRKLVEFLTKNGIEYDNISYYPVFEPKGLVLKRAAESNFPIDVIERMYRNYEELTEEECEHLYGRD